MRQRINKTILNSIKKNISFLSIYFILAKVKILNKIKLCFIKAYKLNIIYSNIINKLFAFIKLLSNKVIIIALKPKHAFCLINYLLYNYNNKEYKQLVISKLIINKILAKTYNNKHYFKKAKILKNLKSIAF